ncbi:DUF1206 domain-containing protein [Flaviflexus massiliensis]|uniref:DUF1206 domain-containing protein n=1 Tax=Flaviflexus massiliensis TaxID=1522309 RepID=UPI0006D55522|nr:DUF1206 domain-containing protein [Flaviflexus massiliensis]
MNTPSGKKTVNHVTGAARGAASEAKNSKWFEYVARIGYVMTGLIHTMIGWICLRLGLTGNSGESADQSGAIGAFADAPGGAALLFIGGIAMAALALTHLLDVFYGSGRRSKKKASAIIKAISKAVMYAALAYTSIQFALGDSSDSGDSAESATEPFLSSPTGKAIVIGVGVIIIIVGIYHVYKGMSRKFHQDLIPSGDRQIGQLIDKTGLVGYVAKGIALMGVGAMVMWAGFTADVNKARGLDVAFKEALDLPGGGIALAAIGIGFILYGIYSLMRAKYQEM